MEAEKRIEAERMAIPPEAGTHTVPNKNGKT
jgi:hypothetical protein